MSDRRVTISICVSLDARDLGEIDQAANRERISRSAFLVRAAKAWIREDPDRCVDECKGARLASGLCTRCPGAQPRDGYDD